MTLYLPDEYLPALLGHVRVPEDGSMRAVYDTDQILEILQTVHGMDFDDAEDWFCFNIDGAYLGPGTPLYLFKEAPDDPS